MDQLTVTSKKTPEAATSGVFVCLWTISTFLSYISLYAIIQEKSIPNFFNHVLALLYSFFSFAKEANIFLVPIAALSKSTVTSKSFPPSAMDFTVPSPKRM